MAAMISILMVDDDAQIRQLLGDYLSGFGMSVVAVADGKAMDEALEKSTFDLVILDLMLPGEDGLSLCRKLRAKSDIPDPDADRARRGDGSGGRTGTGRRRLHREAFRATRTGGADTVDTAQDAREPRNHAAAGTKPNSWDGV